MRSRQASKRRSHRFRDVALFSCTECVKEPLSAIRGSIYSYNFHISCQRRIEHKSVQVDENLYGCCWGSVYVTIVLLHYACHMRHYTLNFIIQTFEDSETIFIPVCARVYRTRKSAFSLVTLFSHALVPHKVFSIVVVWNLLG